MKKIITSADVQSQNIIANAILPGASADSIKADLQKSIDLLEDLGAEPDILEEFRTKTLETATKENIVYKFNTSNLKEKRTYAFINGNKTCRWHDAFGNTKS